MNHQFTFEMPDDTYALVCKAAERAGITVEEYLLDTIRQYMAREPHARELAENREEHMRG